MKDQELSSKYSRIVTSITESLRFMKTVGADTAGQLQTVDFYTSHEALVLQYEEPLTRGLRQPNNTPTISEINGLGIQKGKHDYLFLTEDFLVVSPSCFSEEMRDQLAANDEKSPSLSLSLP